MSQMPAESPNQNQRWTCRPVPTLVDRKCMAARRTGKEKESILTLPINQQTQSPVLSQRSFCLDNPLTAHSGTSRKCFTTHHTRRRGLKRKGKEEMKRCVKEGSAFVVFSRSSRSPLLSFSRRRYLASVHIVGEIGAKKES